MFEVRSHHFFPEGSGNIISSQKKLWKCPIYSRNDLHLFHANICILIVCRKSSNEINEKSRKGINRYFYNKKLPHFNGNAIPIILMIKISIYYRRNLNLFHANTFILQKIFELINEKSRKGINEYFYIKKFAHFNGNGAFPQLFV